MSARLDILKTRLEMYLAAETAILQAQSYTIGSRALTRADLKEVRETINTLEMQINSLGRGGRARPITINPLH